MVNEQKLLQGLLRFSHFHLFDITEEEISGEALLAIEKNDIKKIGVEPMGQRIQLMAKIKEIINTGKGRCELYRSGVKIETFFSEKKNNYPG